jgi:hypothetical protein
MYMPRENQEAYEQSSSFDYDSIMIYGSKDNSVDGRPVLSTKHGAAIFTGGNPNPQLACPSPLDIERVRYLYPKQPGNRQSIQRKPVPIQDKPVPIQRKPVPTQGNPPKKRSEDANDPSTLTATITPVPVDSPRPVNDSSANQMPANIQVAKRWFSLPTPQEAPPGMVGLWPPYGGEGGPHIAAYCFEDGHAWQQTRDVFLEALGKWSRSYIRSSLAFAPDAACPVGDNVPCLCGARVDETTVHIMLSPDSMFRSTFGYLDPRHPRIDPNKPRH